MKRAGAFRCDGPRAGGSGRPGSSPPERIERETRQSNTECGTPGPPAAGTPGHGLDGEAVHTEYDTPGPPAAGPRPRQRGRREVGDDRHHTARVGTPGHGLDGGAVYTEYDTPGSSVSAPAAGSAGAYGSGRSSGSIITLPAPRVMATRPVRTSSMTP